MPILPRYANTMGWFSINILLPVFAPLALLFIAGKICTPIEPFASRVKVLNAVKDGQLSWVAVVLSANASYELCVNLQSGSPPNWAGPILFFNVLNLMLSFEGEHRQPLSTIQAMLAVLGALFPVTEPTVTFRSLAPCLLHYRLLCVSTFTMIIAAVLHCVVHFALGLACK